MRLSEDDHTRVSDAITSAERSTSGEIFCVLAEETDDFRAVPFAWAALAALVLPPVLLWFGVLTPGLLGSPILGGWTMAGDQTANIRSVVALYVALSAALFMLIFLIVRIPAIKRRLTPASLRRTAVHRTAMESFLSHGIHVTEERTGVLIFLSVGDHVAEIVADEGIYRLVDNDMWGDAISLLLDHVRRGQIAAGFVASIGACGGILEEHFPPRENDLNELPDKLIEI